MKTIEVFNIEFEGIDKCGKNTIIDYIISYCPNIYKIKDRGLISQISYAKIFNRNIEYRYSNGYIDNTLFVLLTVDEDDWNIRCDISREHEKNKLRTDVEDVITWKLHSEIFESVYEDLKSKYNPTHFMKFNTSKVTPIEIIKTVVYQAELLNNKYIQKN